MNKDRRLDVYLWCQDDQKKFIGTSTNLKTGDILTGNSKKYIVKAAACGVAVVKEVK